MYTYSTHALPSPRTHASRPTSLAALALKYTALRLEALRTSPHAYASTDAIESTFTADEWAARIWRDDAVVLVCVAHPIPLSQSPDAADPLAGAWAASAILRGPLPLAAYALPPASGAPPRGADDAESKWQMTALFAAPAHRGRGLAKMLVRAGKDYARSHSPGRARVRMRVGVHPDTLAVIALYTAAGFAAAGRATGLEAFRTNGDMGAWAVKAAGLSEDERVMWTTKRVAVCLEWVGAQQ
ncbi:hypothetical protein FB451DRAFT_1048425 [Mycena latifolia]|nr:hypothetical protein FB451DRAFT_1048425 [Mycena latifolia]